MLETTIADAQRVLIIYTVPVANGDVCDVELLAYLIQREFHLTADRRGALVKNRIFGFVIKKAGLRKGGFRTNIKGYYLYPR